MSTDSRTADPACPRIIRLAMTPGDEPSEYVVSDPVAAIEALQRRVEALERSRRADAKQAEQVRRAIGQLAAAVGLLPK